MLKNCNCENYCFACVSQHSAFVDLVWSITENAGISICDQMQKKCKNELWWDETQNWVNMENAMNEAISLILFETMTEDEIKELTK